MLALLLILAFVLTARQQQNGPPPARSSKPIGSFDDRKGASQPPFQSVGVRGTIDAGGYAASAGAKAQNQFFEQLTDLQVALLRPSCESNSARRDAIGLMARGDFTSAVHNLEQLLHGAEDQPATRRLLGLAYEGAGQCAAAAEQFRAASADDAGLFAQSVALLLEGDVTAAETMARRGLERNSGQASRFRLLLGAAMFQRGDVDNALQLFGEAATAKTSDPAPFQFIAIAVRSASAPVVASALNLLKSATSTSPQNASAHYALACAFSASAGNVESELKQAIALDPHLADAQFRLASLYAERQDLPAAIAEFRAALESNPRLIEAHYRLGQLYSRTSQPKLAAEELDLHQQLRARQKTEIESGRVPIHLSPVIPVALAPCSPASLPMIERRPN